MAYTGSPGVFELRVHIIGYANQHSAGKAHILFHSIKTL